MLWGGDEIEYGAGDGSSAGEEGKFWVSCLWKLAVLRLGKIRVRIEKIPEDGKNSREDFLFLVRQEEMRRKRLWVPEENGDASREFQGSNRG